MLRPTLRRNGEHMVTIRVTHHLSRYQAALCLCRYAAVHLNPEDGDVDSPLPRAKVEAVIREEMWLRAMWDMDGWSDSLTDEEQEKIEKWAEESLDKAGWPANF
jgi:hypothetical protein